MRVGQGGRLPRRVSLRISTNPVSMNLALLALVAAPLVQTKQEFTGVQAPHPRSVTMGAPAARASAGQRRRAGLLSVSGAGLRPTGPGAQTSLAAPPGVSARPAGPQTSIGPTSAPDCNGNGIPDSLDITSGASPDCQGDGVPDECQLASALTYRHDDGTLNSAVSWPHAHLAWLASHEVRPGHEIVTSVQVAWGSMPPGSPAKVALWRDPNGDGDPADAVPLMEVETTSSEEFTGSLVEVDVPDTWVGPVGSRFFVGVYGTFGSSWLPIAVDTDTTLASQRSYLVASDAPIQSDDLLSGAAVSGVIGDGDWMVRAVSCPGGHCGESVDVDYSGQPDECEPSDCNGNGVPDAQDIGVGTSPDCQGDGVPDECQVAVDLVYGDTQGFTGAIGIAQDHYAWLTAAVIQPGGEVITSIEIAHGTAPAGTPLTVALWSDPNGDGDPADAQLLVSAETTTSLEFSGQYVSVNVPDTVIGPAGTSFFVGAYGQFEHDWFVAGHDNLGDDELSWFISSDTPIDPNALAAGVSVYGLIGALCCPGDWTVRAVSCTTGHCGESADLNANGVPDECDPDCDGNGTPDDYDLLSGLATDCDGNGVPDACESLTDCDGNGLPDLCQALSPTGLAAEYYEGTNLSGTPLNRIDPNVDFNFDQDPPFPGFFPTEYFSVRWTGAVLTGPAGTYTFALEHDDGVRLWVNGELLIDRWQQGPGTQTATIDLAAATEYFLRLEYFEGFGNARVRLLWQPPGGALGPIQPADLMPIYDRNGDGVPDGCQVVDCNANGVADADDIAFGTSSDCDGDGAPDECRPCEDCDGNGLLDSCELGLGSGLVGQYFLISTPQDPRVFLGTLDTRIDPNVDFFWGSGAPAGIPDDDFGVRWTGTLTTPPASGSYTFHLECDDGVRLWLDGVLLIDEWYSHPLNTFTASTTLAGSTDHLLVLEYFEAAGDAVCSLRWTPPGGAEVAIPSSALRPDTDLNGDGVPDLCAADCDLDGVPDSLEVDLNANCIPDECEGGTGYWRFEEAGGPGALDSTGNGLHGSLSPQPVRVPDVPVATVPATGAANLQALSLEWQGFTDGGFVTVPDAGGLLSVGGSSFTLEAWVRLDSLSVASGSDQRQWLFMKKPSASSDVLIEYGLLVQAGSETESGTGRELLFRYGDGTGVFNVASTLEIDDLEWHFVSLAYDAPRRLLRFGLDGAFESHLLDKPAISNSGPLLIGAHENGSGVRNQFLRGTIDEARFTRAFRAEEELLD